MTDQPAMSLAAALEEWLKVKTAARGLSAHTLRAYRPDIATFATHLTAPTHATATPRNKSTSPT